MKKRVSFLILFIILALAVLMFFLISNFTGRVVEELDKKVQFYFYDEDSNCPLNGYVFVGDKVIGKSNNGLFDLSYENYLENVQENEGISIFGELGSCFNEPGFFFDKYFVIPNIEKYEFTGEKIFNFKTNINFNNPSQKELQGFIQKDNVKSELKKIKTYNRSILEDLSEINNHLSIKINYIEDWDFDKEINYWQTPLETLRINQGDCEDYSTSLLSLFLAYDNSLNCYNLIFSSHVTTFCYAEDHYVYYDQNMVEVKKQINKQSLTKAKPQLLKLKKDYFDKSGVEEDFENKAYYAFNDNDFVEFENEDDFLNWQYNLENKRQDFDLFSQIESEMIENLKDLSSEWEEGGLKTQTVSLPTSKFTPYLIIGLFVVMIVLVVILVKINKK